MPAFLTAYVPDQPARQRLIGPDEAVVAGRSEDCDLVIPHRSVSRRHARLAPDGDELRLSDLGSRNGSFADGERVEGEARLRPPCWIRLGDVYCELESIAADEADRRARRAASRRSASAVMARERAAETDLERLLGGSLHDAMSITDSERGCLLLLEGGELRVAASEGMAAGELDAPAFSGSAAAVRRCLSEDSAVVANDIEPGHWLGARPSVAAGGIRALVALPLREAGRPIGALYLDSRRPGAAVTELDVELLEAFGGRIALALAARGLARSLRELDAGSVGAADGEGRR